MQVFGKERLRAWNFEFFNPMNSTLDKFRIEKTYKNYPILSVDIFANTGYSTQIPQNWVVSLHFFTHVSLQNDLRLSTVAIL